MGREGYYGSFTFKTTIRKCLRCDRDFKSYGIGNRRCKKCNRAVLIQQEKEPETYRVKFR